MTRWIAHVLDTPIDDFAAKIDRRLYPIAMLMIRCNNWFLRRLGLNWLQD